MLQFKKLTEDIKNNTDFYNQLDKSNTCYRKERNFTFIYDLSADDKEKTYNIIVDKNNYKKIITFCGYNNASPLLFFDNDITHEDYEIYKFKHSLRFILFNYGNKWHSYTHDFYNQLITLPDDTEIQPYALFNRVCKKNSFNYKTLEKSNCYVFDIVYKNLTNTGVEVKSEIYHVMTRQNTDFMPIDYKIDIDCLSIVKFENKDIMREIITKNTIELETCGFIFINNKTGELFNLYTNFYDYLRTDLFINEYNELQQFEYLYHDKKLKRYESIFIINGTDNIMHYTKVQNFINTYVLKSFNLYRDGSYHGLLSRYEYREIFGQDDNFTTYLEFENELISFFEVYHWKYSWENFSLESAILEDTNYSDFLFRTLKKIIYNHFDFIKLATLDGY